MEALVTVTVYVADAPVTLAEPGDVAVSTHCPGERAVIVDPLITHGPVSASTTVAPDAADALRSVFEPALTLIGSPGFHGAPPCGLTVIVS